MIQLEGAGSMQNEVDLTNLNNEQLLQGIADMVLSLLRSHRVALVVSRQDGAITFINPLILQGIPQEALAAALIESWDEVDVADFMEHLYG
jgi:hypothetical protein